MTTLVLTLDIMKLVMDTLPTVNTMSFFLMAAPKLSPTMLEMITLDTLPMFNTLVKLNMLLHQLTNLLLLPTTQLPHPTTVELSMVKPDNLYCHIFLRLNICEKNIIYLQFPNINIIPLVERKDVSFILTIFPKN